MLYDNHGRKIDYLRLAVTDRCNLRCFYCMPHEGIDFVPRSDLLTYEELLRLCSVFSELGIRKIRITGGEPFVRKGIDSFLRELSKTPGLEELNITTNGSFTANKIKLMEEIGVKSVNLSLDTLNQRTLQRNHSTRPIRPGAQNLRASAEVIHEFEDQYGCDARPKH